MPIDRSFSFGRDAALSFEKEHATNVDRDEQIHNLFAVLESAVNMVASIDCVSGGIDDWFRDGHHLSYQERWDRFRDIRQKSNDGWIEHYGELLHKAESMLEPLTDLYWRVKPQLVSITFREKPDDVIVQTAELLRAAIRWHGEDFGYWKAFREAPDHEEAQRNRKQIEASNARYPLTEKEGRQWIGYLRDARGLMLLAADQRMQPGQANNELEGSVKKGVGFIDVAQFVINRGWEREIKPARKLAKRWADKEKFRPETIGESQEYKGRPIFKVSDAVKYLDQFIKLDTDERKELRQYLNGIAKPPRDESSESVGNRRKA